VAYEGLDSKGIIRITLLLLPLRLIIRKLWAWFCSVSCSQIQCSVWFKYNDKCFYQKRWNTKCKKR